MQTTFSFYGRKLKLTNIINKSFEEQSTILFIEEMRKLETMRQYAGISQSYKTKKNICMDIIKCDF